MDAKMGKTQSRNFILVGAESRKVKSSSFLERHVQNFLEPLSFLGSESGAHRQFLDRGLHDLLQAAKGVLEKGKIKL